MFKRERLHSGFFPILCGGLVPEIQRHCCFNGNASFFGNNITGGFL